jgi:transposase-like protein
MIQQENGQSPPDQPKRKGNYTGERLKVLRPETYRRVVQLLAEPREHVSIREICRRCHVTDDTVKAIEQREAIPIATRKQALMEQAARIARLAADRVEEQIDSATLPHAVVTFGVMTDKVLALSGDPAMIVRHELEHHRIVEHHIKPMTDEDYMRLIRGHEKQTVEPSPLDSGMHLLPDAAQEKKNPS